MKRPLIILTILLTLALAALTLLLLRERTTVRELTQEFELDKQDLENQYTDFARQYDELRLTVSNDSLSLLLEQEQLKTQRLLEELRTVRSTNATEIRRLKNELATLRRVMVGYVNQIDSLNRLAAHQRQLIADISRHYDEASRRLQHVEQEKQELTRTVSLAAQLDATAITVTPLNKKGKKTDKLKYIVKLQIAFTLARNVTAPTGDRTLYLRITKPDNSLLTRNPSTLTFPYENRQLPYTASRSVEYRGEPLPVTIYWDVQEYLYAGTYRADIFTDGTLIGTQTFTL